MPSTVYLLFSLASLGFFGGFTHCMGMCGPFVITQVSSRLENVALEKFSGLTRLRNLALLPYHLGRITTYSIIGFFCSLLSSHLAKFEGFRIVSAILLIFATIFFLDLAFKRKNFFPKLKFLKLSSFFERFFLKRISFLFKNPQGLKGFLLGNILGFIPCGLLYGAFIIAATIPNPFVAFFGMFLFGISTFPALFLVASGGYFFFRIDSNWFRILTKIVVLINVISLIILAIKSL